MDEITPEDMHNKNHSVICDERKTNTVILLGDMFNRMDLKILSQVIYP